MGGKFSDFPYFVLQNFSQSSLDSNTYNGTMNSYLRGNLNMIVVPIYWQNLYIEDANGGLVGHTFHISAVEGNIFTFEYGEQISAGTATIEAGSKVYVRKDSKFHSYIDHYSDDIGNFVNTGKTFIYLGEISQSGSNYLVTFRGLKDFVVEALPINNRTTNMTEFLDICFDRVYNEIYGSQKKISSLQDAKEVDISYLNYLADAYSMPIDVLSIYISNFTKREWVDSLIYFLKRKGTYSAIYIIWKVFLQNTINTMKIYEMWHNSDVVGIPEGEFYEIPYENYYGVEPAGCITTASSNYLYQIAFDAQTGTFTAGNTIYQTVDGVQVASALIDYVGSGILYLSNIIGTFQDNEIIYEDSYGSELLTGGDCTSDSFNDDDVGVSWHWTYKYIWYGTSTDNANIYQEAIVTIGSFYKVLSTFTRTAGQARVAVGHSGTGVWHTTSGSFTEHLQASGDTSFYVTGDLNFIGDGDDFSVKKITNAALANGTVTYDEGISSYYGQIAPSGYPYWPGEGSPFTTITAMTPSGMILSPHYKVEIDFTCEPLGDTYIVNEEILDDLLTGWNYTKPVSKFAHYQQLISPIGDFSDNYVSLYGVGYNAHMSTKFVGSVYVSGGMGDVGDIRLIPGAVQQEVASTVWDIYHGLDSSTVMTQIYDNDKRMIKPGAIKIIGDDVVQMEFDTSVRGYAYSSLATAAENGYTHVQSVPSSAWSINHSLSTERVLMQAYDANGEMIMPADSTFVDADNATMTWGPSAVSGTVLVKIPDYEYDQSGSELSTWTIQHDQNVVGLIAQFCDNDGRIIPNEFNIISSDLCTAIWSEPVSGWALIDTIDSDWTETTVISSIDNWKVGTGGSLTYDPIITSDLETVAISGSSMTSYSDASYYYFDITLPKNIGDLEITEIGLFNVTPNIIYYTTCSPFHKPNEMEMIIHFRIGKS